jgi:hypothetical protein
VFISTLLAALNGRRKRVAIKTAQMIRLLYRPTDEQLSPQRRCVMECVLRTLASPFLSPVQFSRVLLYASNKQTLQLAQSSTPIALRTRSSLKRKRPLTAPDSFCSVLFDSTSNVIASLSSLSLDSTRSEDADKPRKRPLLAQ